MLQPRHVRNFLTFFGDVETDHKLFVPLLGVKDLHCLPPCILRFRLHLDRFSFDITHVPGKELYTADTLSRAPLHSKISFDSADLSELAELCEAHVITNLPVGNEKLDLYRKAQLENVVCILLLCY